MRTKIHCPNCGPVYGDASLHLRYTIGIGNEGIARDQSHELTQMPARIELTCSECHNLSVHEDETPTADNEEHVRDELYRLFLRDIDTLKAKTLFS